MKATFALRTALSAALFSISLTCAAGVGADEAAKLKNELTPFGAEKAGNAAGTIPAWTGAYNKIPSGFKTGQLRPDVFAAEKPLFTITAANMAQYIDKLSDGQIALLKKHPDYRLHVYPTRRTAGAPQWVYDNTFKNATRATITSNGSVAGAYGGIPFPIPKVGEEAMWNHLLRWNVESTKSRSAVWIVGADGKAVLTSGQWADIKVPYYSKDGSLEKFNGDYQLISQVTEAPSFKVGESILLRDSLDMTQGSSGRQAWQYLVGQRRVRRAPTLAYDSPNPVSSGLEFFDETFIFMGALDRYQWKIVGKKELFIPYNSNGLQFRKNEELYTPNFPNPDAIRWELHRVWVIEANLAPGKRHVMPKRRFYLDEDTWGAALADGYDAQGQLWHTAYQPSILAFDIPAVLYQGQVTIDVLKGGYSTSFYNLSDTPQVPVENMPNSLFTPEALAARGVR